MDFDRLDVYYNDEIVGVLKQETHHISFSYDPSWLEHGFSISPRSLPLQEGEFISRNPHFGGLFAVFADSLPDGWGTLLSKSYFKHKEHRDYLKIGVLERLTYLGDDALGGLRYAPSGQPLPRDNIDSFDEVAKHIISFTKEGDLSYLDQLYAYSRSTGGARPKIHVLIDNEEWIIKFPDRHDKMTSGRMEYEYYLAALESGIPMSECRLLPSSICDGYFATKRFDRVNGNRKHVLSLCGLLESPHNLPLLDYETYLKAAQFITGSINEVYKAFRYACFNIFAKNYDDHSKNFAFIYDESLDSYVLSPAYDLTWCVYAPEHQMTCSGNGLPMEEDLRELAKKLGLSLQKAKAIIHQIKTVVESRLGEWIDD